MKTANVTLYPTTTAFLVEYDNGQVRVTVLNVSDDGNPDQAERHRAEIEDFLDA